MLTNLYLQFAKQAKLTPHAYCLSNGDEKLTYGEALARIHGIAEYLQQKGVSTGEVVALYSSKNIESVLCFLAIARLGAVTLTLDIAFPLPMMEFILKDAQVKWVISEAIFPLKTALPIITFSDCVAKSTCNEEALEQIEGPLAWIVYSSGTTGNPKGIAISHQAMLSSIFSRYQFSDYHPADKVACSIYFFWEVFRPLFRGACAFIVSDELLVNILSYAKFIQKYQIEETLWTPSFAQMLLQTLSPEDLTYFSCLKRVWLNGEVVCRQLAESALDKLQQVQFFNLYSISETFDVAAEPLAIPHLSKDGFASIGRPLAGVKAWILDENLNLCQANQCGELYIGSPFLAEGYLNREDLQQQSFITLQNINKNERLFKTKDTAYQNEAGELFVLGRNDYIVKLRGYNVSLLAIEDVIKRVLPVKQCVVTLEGENTINQTIVATIQPHDIQVFLEMYDLDASTGISSQLQKILTSFLPAYAVPTKFMLSDAFQCNQYSAKLDRKLFFKENPLALSTKGQKLQCLWGELLQIPSDAIRRNSDFFILGGNSLLAIQYVQRVRQDLNVCLDLSVLYEYPQFEAQLHLMEGRSVQAKSTAESVLEDVTTQFKSSLKAAEVKTSLKTARSVLITGATGFLGAHWLADCLAKSGALFYCLIRAEDSQSGYQRLEHTFQKYNLDLNLLKERVVVLPGSLSTPYLGQNATVWQSLTNEVDLILHAAASVNLVYPYQKLKPATIDGTKTILELALSTRLKPLVLISSDAVFSAKKTYMSNAFLPTLSIHGLDYGYAQAKWGQEQLVKIAAQEYHLPYLIVRLGNLSPSLGSGKGNENDANSLLFHRIKNLKKIPENLSLEFSPVDKVVNYLTRLCQDEIDQCIITLSDNNVLSEKKIRSLLADWNLKPINNEVWLELMQTIDPNLYNLWRTGRVFPIKKRDKAAFLNQALIRELILNDEELHRSLHLIAHEPLTSSAKTAEMADIN